MLFTKQFHSSEWTGVTSGQNSKVTYHTFASSLIPPKPGNDPWWNQHHEPSFLPSHHERCVILLRPAYNGREVRNPRKHGDHGVAHQMSRYSACRDQRLVLDVIEANVFLIVSGLSFAFCMVHSTDYIHQVNIWQYLYHSHCAKAWANKHAWKTCCNQNG